jgi:ubiquinone/menaquinone biosynthesis C-methylase UbiE
MEPRLQLRVQRYGWDKAADYYERSWKKQLKPAQDRLLEMAGLQSGQSVLETSCGTGLVTLRAAEKVAPGGSVMATDLSESMLTIARQRIDQSRQNHVTFQRMDAENLEFEDHQFDMAFCCLGLMYFPNPLNALQEMYRVIKSGSRVVLAVWGERNRCGWADIFPIVDKRVATDVCPMFFQQGTGNSLKLTMQNAGFTAIETDRFQTILHYPNPEEAIMAAFSGGPVALAYNKFDQSTKIDSHREYLESIEPYRKGDRFEIPGEFVVASGRKPLTPA